MTFFKEFQSLANSAEFKHPLAPGANGTAGYGRTPGAWGVEARAGLASEHQELRHIQHPLASGPAGVSPSVAEKVEKMYAYGPEDVPRSMRKRGWPVAARLIEFWLNGPAVEMPDHVRDGKTPASKYGQVNIDSIKMDWVQTFPRGKQAVTEILNVLNSEKAQNSIRSTIKGNYPNVVMSSATVLKIDNSLLNVVALHEARQYQMVRVGSLWGGIGDELNELKAALGKFAIMDAIRKADISEGVIRVTEVGIYVKNIFDFTGWLPLGCWSDVDVERFGDSRTYCSRIKNDKFSEYRILKNKGRDFILFSDILVHKIDFEIGLCR